MSVLKIFLASLLACSALAASCTPTVSVPDAIGASLPAGGTGCPTGTAIFSFANEGAVMTILFGQDYSAIWNLDDNIGVESTKNCTFSVNLTYPPNCSVDQQYLNIIPGGSTEAKAKSNYQIKIADGRSYVVGSSRLQTL